VRQFTIGFSDGPTEVHKVTTARQILKGYKPAPGLWPTEHLPTKRKAAREKVDAELAAAGFVS
jgi:acyl-CoA dehydrogenase